MLNTKSFPTGHELGMKFQYNDNCEMEIRLVYYWNVCQSELLIKIILTLPPIGYHNNVTIKYNKTTLLFIQYLQIIKRT